LRAGEIAALKVKHLSLTADNPSLTVVEAASEVNGKLTFGEPKTQASRRTVPLPAFLASQLRSHLGDRRLNPESYLFLSEQGGPWRHSNFMGRFWRPAVIRALPPHLHSLRFHDLRHTCASILISEGAHPKQISEWLGHSSITITLDRYGHLFPHLGQQLAQRLDTAYRASLNPGPPTTDAEVVNLPLR
jgi:integrase